MISKKHIPFFLLWVAVYCILGNVSLAQETQVSVNAAVDRSQVLLGEQFKLRLEINAPSSQPVTQWFNVPDTFNHLEVIERTPVDSFAEGDVKKYMQQFTITGFDSGAWNIPALPAVVGNKTYSTQPVTIAIVPVPLQDSTYHDIHEIINVPGEKTPWWYWVAGILSLLLIGVLIWLWLKTRSKQPVRPAANSTEKLSALQEALEQLRQLQQENLPAKGEWKQYYSTLSGIVKAYSRKRFSLPALQYTTDELLVQLNNGASMDTLSKLAESLRMGDAVKFAKYQPGTEQAFKDITNIETALRELDRLKQ
ncbi:MAG: BatD family protein [Chitinophagaceae bacterium]|nr:BatD family protein [Chitinophagaceae bacterium]